MNGPLPFEIDICLLHAVDLCVQTSFNFLEEGSEELIPIDLIFVSKTVTAVSIDFNCSVIAVLDAIVQFLDLLLVLYCRFINLLPLETSVSQSVFSLGSVHPIVRVPWDEVYELGIFLDLFWPVIRSGYEKSLMVCHKVHCSIPLEFDVCDLSAIDFCVQTSFDFLKEGLANLLPVEFLFISERIMTITVYLNRGEVSVLHAVVLSPLVGLLCPLPNASAALGTRDNLEPERVIALGRFH